MGYRIRHLREDRACPFVVEERLLWRWRRADMFKTRAGAEAFVADRERPRIIWQSGDPVPTAKVADGTAEPAAKGAA